MDPICRADDKMTVSREELPEEAERDKKVSLWKDNRGVGVVELILILVVLIALVLIFKTQLTGLVNTIFKAISKNANKVLK